MERTTRSKKSLQNGASLVEYGLLVALIAIIAFPAIQYTGRNAKCNTYVAATLLTAEFNDDPHLGKTTYVKFGYCGIIGISGEVETAKDDIYSYCMTGGPETFGVTTPYAVCFP